MYRLIVVLLMLVFPVVSQAQDLTQDITSDETQITFSIPEGWTSTFNPGGASILTLTGDEIGIEIYTPSTLMFDRIDDATKANEVLSRAINLYEWEEGDFETVTINDRIITVAEYEVDGFAGILIAVPLENEQFALVDTFEWDSSLDRDIILEIASTIEQIPPPLTLDNYDGNWRGVVEQLEENDVIPTGGQLVFVEDRAFFSGQGSFFTPLAENSPQTNIVMAATLDFTVGSDFNETSEPETCNLLARLQTDSEGFSQQFLEVGLDNVGALYYYTAIDGEISNYGEFRRLELDTTHHVLFVASGEQLTIFLDGVQAAASLPIDEVSGTFGITLRGFGPGAECVGENIWVYSIPQVQTGACRVTSTSNVNKRTGPGTNFDIGGQLQASTTEEIIGQAVGADGFVWWQLEDENWVRNDVVQQLGDCSDIPDADI